MRIRTIKPEFWSHPVTGRLDGELQAFLIALLNYADDDGYFQADPAAVRSAVRPFDDESSTVRRLVARAVEIGWCKVKKHPTHGAIGFIPTFAEHQRIDKPKISKLKQYWDVAFDDSSTTNPRHVDDASTLEGKGREQGKEGKGTGTVGGTNPAEPPPSGPPVLELLKSDTQSTVEALRCLWNANRAPTMPEWQSTAKARQKHAQARLREHSLAVFETVIKKLAASDFASGRTGKWTATADWLVDSPGNVLKVLEGNYDNREGRAGVAQPSAFSTTGSTTTITKGF